jgi:hypothetical protein
MLQLYDITIPGFSTVADLPTVRHRLLAQFPLVREVLATLVPSTIRIVYQGQDEIDRWLEVLSKAAADSRLGLEPAAARRTAGNAERWLGPERPGARRPAPDSPHGATLIAAAAARNDAPALITGTD